MPYHGPLTAKARERLQKAYPARLVDGPALEPAASPVEEIICPICGKLLGKGVFGRGHCVELFCTGCESKCLFRDLCAPREDFDPSAKVQQTPKLGEKSWHRTTQLATSVSAPAVTP